MRTHLGSHRESKARGCSGKNLLALGHSVTKGIAKASEMAHVAPHTDLSELRLAMSQALLEMDGDLDRAQQLLGEAVAKLFHSFQGMRSDLKAQQASFDEVAVSLVGGNGNAGFASVLGRVIEEFVEAIVATSTKTIQLLDRMDSFNVQVTSIAELAGKIEDISGQTKQISLNARIEAHRAGAAGSVFRVVADEVKELANESRDLGSQIGEVVQGLQSSFKATQTVVAAMASHDMTSALEAKNRLTNILTKLEEINDTVAKTLARVSENIAAAIEALQFEDMLLQLISGVQRRLRTLEAICAQPWEDGATLTSGLAEGVAHRGPQAVSQASMEVGGVELF